MQWYKFVKYAFKIIIRLSCSSHEVRIVSLFDFVDCMCFYLDFDQVEQTTSNFTSVHSLVLVLHAFKDLATSAANKLSGF